VDARMAVARRREATMIRGMEISRRSMSDDLAAAG
jgi:hypothetical protein